MGIKSIKSNTGSRAAAKGSGVVITKSSRGIKVTDNGVIRMKFTVISKTELKGYKHPLYKPLIP